MKKTILSLMFCISFLLGLNAQIGNVTSHHETGKPAMVVKDLKVTKTTSDETATIRLTVGTVSNGYQVLLDPDCEMYDYAQDVSIDQNCYDNCEYKIPSGAVPSPIKGDLTQSLVDATDSVEVPEGFYDLLVVTPSYMIFVGLWRDNGEHSVWNNIYFKAGYEYHFYVEGPGDTVDFLCVSDLELIDITIPEASDTLGDAEEIKLKVANTGTETVSDIKFYYQINDGDIVTEEYDQSIAPEAEVSYTFNTKGDFTEAGIYSVKIWIEGDLDLNPVNSLFTRYTRNSSPYSLPFVEEFESEIKLEYQWKVHDLNGDGVTWWFPLMGGDGVDDIYGHVGVAAPWGKVADEVLVLDNRVAFDTAGTYHLLYYVKSTGTKETYKILYGKTDDYTEMDVLAEYTDETGYYWKVYVVHFDITEPGNYYFAFYYTGDSNNQASGVKLDRITLAEGRFVGIPDIEIGKAVLPMPACGMTDVEISIPVSNKGSEPITEFKLKYEIPGGATVEETFNETIELNKSITVSFQTKADLSEPGTYDIAFTASTENEENFNNNSSSATTTHYDPIKALPFENDFSLAEDLANWNPVVTNGWAPNAFRGSYAVSQINVLLVSRCITLTEGAYTFSYEFLTGAEVYGSLYPGTFEVRFGKVGTPYDEMEVIDAVAGEYTYNEFLTRDITVDISEADEYVFGFVFTEGDARFAGLYIRTVILSEGVGIGKVDASNTLAIYPNPTSDKVTIKSNERIESIRVYDATGKELYNNRAINQTEYKLNVKDAGLNQGIYFVTVQTETGSTTSKLLVK